MSNEQWSMSNGHFVFRLYALLVAHWSLFIGIMGVEGVLRARSLIRCRMISYIRSVANICSTKFEYDDNSKDIFSFSWDRKRRICRVFFFMLSRRGFEHFHLSTMSNEQWSMGTLKFEHKRSTIPITHYSLLIDHCLKAFGRVISSRVSSAFKFSVG